MKKDIEYFTENALNERNIVAFHANLPEKLRNLFKKNCNCNWGQGIVLQGYRGPRHMRDESSGDSDVLDPQNGVQEIRHWWGPTKKVNLLPGIGTVAFAIVRTDMYFRGRLEWNSLYFDTKTGECIGGDVNEAADALNKKGCALFEAGNFSDALEYYKNASKLTTKSSREFSNNVGKAQAEIDACSANHQGNDFLINGKYKEALAKFEEACSKSKVEELLSNYEANKKQAQTEIDCANLNSIGEDLFLRGEFDEALNKFNEAYERSNDVAERVKYGFNGGRAEIEGKAASLSSRGDKCFQEERYVDALILYIDAYEMSKIDSKRGCYRSNMTNAQFEVDASALHLEGDKLFNSGHYHDALQKYQDAYNRSKEDKHKDKYSSSCSKAESEIAAAKLNAEGNDLLSKGELENAVEKFQEALNKSTLDAEKNKYRRNCDQAQAEIDAINLDSTEGDRLFNSGKYEEALRTYQSGVKKSKSDEQRTTFTINIEKTQAELDAANLNNNADELFYKEEYDIAFEMYKKAEEMSSVRKQKVLFASNWNRTETIICNIALLDTLWTKAWEAENDTETNRYVIAKDKFQRVLNEAQAFSKLFPSTSKFQTYINLATMKIEGNDLFNEGIELHERGVECINKGQYESARDVLKEAKEKFEKAMEKFVSVKSEDKNFESCIAFVKEQLKGIHAIERDSLFHQLQKLNIDQVDEKNETTNAVDFGNVDNNYFQQI